jgi:hypothetical protein
MTAQELVDRLARVPRYGMVCVPYMGDEIREEYHGDWISIADICEAFGITMKQLETARDEQ